MVSVSRPPRSVLVCDSSTFLHEKNRVTTQVEQLHFNYKVSLLLPECSSAPSHLDGVLNGFSSFYLIRNLPIYELLDRDFLQSAVFQGSVYGLSYRTRIDEDNCVALMPDGHLVLSLDKDSFEVLGVEGKPSRFNHRTKSRFVVSVDLCDGSMAPGGRGYQRLHTGLRSRLQMKADFLLSHHPGGGASLQALLSRYDWSEHRPAVSSRTLTDLPCPTLLTSDLQPRDSHSVLEWLGAVDAAISCQTPSHSFLSSLACPEPKTAASCALSVSVCGLLLPHDIHRLIQQIRRHLEQPRLASWASLTVHGFADSPVCWGRDEHSALKVGENFYSLLMFQDHSYQLYLAAGAHDSCPP
ncbi:ribonuclease P protein subunit p40 [Takifugu flavidus]|uniref:Ribonuclease P protein subunit p40 n=1 Tax=Takifugu flavidus TaxID=433684 RepID=A0A5C6P2Z0_9TELE|nr:ribonuclease P protein subunit p40 [Takifugu flavidus]TWW73131.1 Ribonuclease P protein subunit p40 [Takifugu flavidus]